MATLYKIGDKAKAVLILLAFVFGTLNKVFQALVRIFDDNEVTTAEALHFAMEDVPVYVGDWKAYKGTGKAPSEPADENHDSPDETLLDVLKDAGEDVIEEVTGRKRK